MIHCLVLNKVIPIFTYNDVADDHKWNYQQRGMTFDKDLNLKGKYCHHPFNTITVDSFGDVYVCICQAWLPISVGKIWEFDNLDSIVTSPRAKEIQASILDGSYRYCDNNTCGIIQNEQLFNRIYRNLNTVNWINFALDPSCNLTCPSCRNEFKFLSEGPEFELRIKIVNHLIKLIENHTHWIKFTLSGDGDPFASLIYRHLLENLNIKNNNKIEIEIVTNGILIKAHWYKLQGVYNNLVRCKVSFDAGTESIYNITRRGGDWNKLLDSIKHIVDWKQKNNRSMAITANFVVQTANYKDIVKYVELCDHLGVDEINFQKIDNWGTFNDFDYHAVWKNTHPEHQEFLKLLHHPSLNNSKINLTNLKYLKNEAQ